MVSVLRVSLFLHLELGTTYLLHAIDRYLSPDAAVACLVPGTVFNGHHHEPFRQREFLTSKRPVSLEIAEVWQVQPGTFKYPGAAIIGHKRSTSGGLKTKAISGFLARDSGVETADFSTRAIGTKRTAWVLEKEGTSNCRFRCGHYAPARGRSYAAHSGLH